MKQSLSVTLMLCLSIMLWAQSPKIIAHRGAWHKEQVPQNSIASLQNAIKQKVWGSEFDVHLTKDDVLVVTHDQDFYGLDIATATYEQLLTKKHPNGEFIATAEAYLKEGLKQKNTKLIFEIKSNKLGLERTLKATEMSLQLVKTLHAEDMTIFIAFSYPVCLKIRELDPNIRIQYLNGDKAPEELKRDKISALDYNLGVFKKHPDYIQKSRVLGLETNVWTVNTADDLSFFIQQGVDYITTDRPELLKELLKN